VVIAKITVLDGFELSQAGSHDVLGSRLDELLLFALEYELQANPNPDSYVSL
jgi:hypothetical protein